MLWRLLSVIILLFWAAMMGLVVRDTYFPSHSHFAVVHPRFVFDLFLSEAATLNNTLHLYRDDEKIGYTNFTIRRHGGEMTQPIYSLLISGSVDIPLKNQPKGDVTFRLAGELEDAEIWNHFDLEIHSLSEDVIGSVNWKKGSKMPTVEVKKGGQVIMNTPMMQSMMALKSLTGGEFDWMKQLTQLQQNGSSGTLKAREGVMDLAGRQRRCYVVSLDVLQMDEVQLYFTEIGQLARIELPQGYRLIEPMLHGLERGMNTLQ
jgi:hypothetical protein